MIEIPLRAHLHWASASIQRQRCNDASNTYLIENSGAPEWGCNPIWSESIVFNERNVDSILAALTLTLNVNGPLPGTLTLVDPFRCQRRTRFTASAI